MVNEANEEQEVTQVAPVEVPTSQVTIVTAPTVQMITLQVNVPKESNDVRLLVVGLVRAIKAKKTTMEIASSELPALMTAISGIDQIPNEAKTGEIITLGALMGADIARELMGK